MKGESLISLEDAAAVALEAMEACSYAVANQAPNRDVMKYVAAMAALRAALARAEDQK